MKSSEQIQIGGKASSSLIMVPSPYNGGCIGGFSYEGLNVDVAQCAQPLYAPTVVRPQLFS